MIGHLSHVRIAFLQRVLQAMCKQLEAELNVQKRQVSPEKNNAFKAITE